MTIASGPTIFKAVDRILKPAVTPTGTTEIARVIAAPTSTTMGAGVEYLENTTIEWTVTYDEILFIIEGTLTVVFDQTSHECAVGDIVWLPSGTSLKYIAKTKAGYFYALYPVDWARRQGTVEP